MSASPNILFIVSDQHNPKIAGFAGNTHARTPHLDQLASRSAVFDSAYCQAPLCVPSRMSFLTGRYVAGIGAWSNACILKDAATFGDQISAGGYATAWVGKMHLRGPKWKGGFQSRPYGDLVVDRFCFHQPDPLETWDGRWANHAAARFPFAGASEVPESLLGDAVATREALAWVLEHADSHPDVPWFAAVGYGRPHFPLTAPGRFVRRALSNPPPLPAPPPGFPESLHPHDRFIVDDFRLLDFTDDERRRALACYYACVEYLDDCIGELLRGLERSGALRNTYVIYASDHGDMAGEKGLWWKRTYYDASARVPLLISGPGIEPGRISRLVELTDLFPTLCSLAGAPVPRDIEGESLAPLLGLSSGAYNRKFARSELLSMRKETAFRMVRDEKYKYCEFRVGEPRLFDLEMDPEETTDLLQSADHGVPPERLQSLRRELERGLTWDGIAELQERHPPEPPDPSVRSSHGPVQHQLADGRIVDSDAFLYPGLQDFDQAD